VPQVLQIFTISSSLECAPSLALAHRVGRLLLRQLGLFKAPSYTIYIPIKEPWQTITCIYLPCAYAADAIASCP
jgi:hypothetical protein